MLKLGSNNIVSLGGLTPLGRLQTCLLRSNSIVDCTPLKDKVHLKMLDLRDNKIISVSPLRNLSGLGDGLRLSGNSNIVDIIMLQDVLTPSTFDLYRSWFTRRSLTFCNQRFAILHQEYSAMEKTELLTTVKIIRENANIDDEKLGLVVQNFCLGMSNLTEVDLQKNIARRPCLHHEPEEY